MPLASCIFHAIVVVVVILFVMGVMMVVALLDGLGIGQSWREFAYNTQIPSTISPSWNTVHKFLP